MKHLKLFESFNGHGEYEEIPNSEYVTLRKKFSTLEMSNSEKSRLKLFCLDYDYAISDIKINNEIIASFNMEIGHNISTIYIRKCDDEWWFVTSDISHFGDKYINKQIYHNFKCDGFDSVIHLLSDHLIPYCKKIMNAWS